MLFRFISLCAASIYSFNRWDNLFKGTFVDCKKDEEQISGYVLVKLKSESEICGDASNEFIQFILFNNQPSENLSYHQRIN